jgi:hypothetical protein
MATASLPQDPDLDQLRTRARELQRAVRRGDPDARERVARWHPAPPPAGDGFPLTAAQLVLARQHGFPSWARMRRYVEIVTARAWTPDRPPPADEPLADRFLRLACLTYSNDEDADRVAAARLLAGHPEPPEQSLPVAAEGAPGAVELLAAAGFDVNALGRSDIPSNAPWHTALHVAAEKGDVVLARTLLELGADLTSPTSTTGPRRSAGPVTSASRRWPSCSDP